MRRDYDTRRRITEDDKKPFPFHAVSCLGAGGAAVAGEAASQAQPSRRLLLLNRRPDGFPRHRSTRESCIDRRSTPTSELPRRQCRCLANPSARISCQFENSPRPYGSCRRRYCSSSSDTRATTSRLSGRRSGIPVLSLEPSCPTSFSQSACCLYPGPSVASRYGDPWSSLESYQFYPEAPSGRLYAACSIFSEATSINASTPDRSV